MKGKVGKVLRATLVANPNPGGRCQSVKWRQIQASTIQFYSDQIYLIRYDSSKACLFIGP